MNETGKYVPQEAKKYKICENCFKPENVEGFGDTTDQHNEDAKEAFKNGWLEKVIINNEPMVVFTEKYEEYVKEKSKNRPEIEKIINNTKKTVTDMFLKKMGYSKKNNEEKGVVKKLEGEKESVKDQIKRILDEKGIKFKDIKIKAEKNRKKGGEILYEVKIIGLDNFTFGVNEISYNNQTEEMVLQNINKKFSVNA